MRYFVLIFSLFLFACGAEETAQQNEILQHDAGITNQEKTMNFTDSEGIRQGFWVTYGKDDPARGYPDEGKLEEGNYKDGEKDGEWIYYRPDMGVDSIVNHSKSGERKTMFNLVSTDGKKQGYWIFYGGDFPARGYPDMARIEEGRFKDDLKTGSWIYYDVNGRRDSVVKYESGTAVDVFIPDTTKYKRRF